MEWHGELYGDPAIGGEDPGQGFDRYFDDERPARLVVADAGAPVGMGGLFLRSPASAEVEPLVVVERFRASGVGRALVEALVEAARAKGVRRVVVRPTARNASAIRFFHSAGFDVLGHVDLQLELTEAWSYEPRERLADRPFRV